MKDHNKFKTVVTLKAIKKNAYDPSRDNIMTWLYQNVGPSCFAVGNAQGTWDSAHNYSEDNQNIIESYSFKNPHDATFFALKWSC